MVVELFITTRADLNRHLRENCPLTEKKQKHKCLEDECGKEFSSNQYLREHQHEVHFENILIFLSTLRTGVLQTLQIKPSQKELPSLSFRTSTNSSSSNFYIHTKFSSSITICCYNVNYINNRCSSFTNY